MSKMQDAVSRATRRWKDVRVVLDGELAQEREALVRAIMQAPEESTRLATASLRKTAEAALAAWDDEHRDAVLTVRVRGCLGAEWQKLQLSNPAAKQAKDQSPYDAAFGFDIVAASIDAIEKWGLIVDGDETEQPTSAEWQQFFDSVNPADMAMLTRAVAELNGASSEQVFGDLVKA